MDGALRGSPTRASLLRGRGVVSKGKRGGGPKPSLANDEIVLIAIELLAEPDLATNLPDWPTMDEHGLKKFADKKGMKALPRYPGSRSRRPYINRRRGKGKTGSGAKRENDLIDRHALEKDVIDLLQSESDRLRRTGRTTTNGFMGLNSPQILEKLGSTNIKHSSELAEYFVPHIAETFRGAYEARVDDGSNAGSSHRLRFMLLAHHNREEVRQILRRTLYENLISHRPALEEALNSVGFRTVRNPDAVLLDLAALLDGYLQQAVCQTNDQFDYWSLRFVESVAFFITTNVEPQDCN